MARAVTVAQVLDDFATAADGRPAGWEVVGVGAEATIAHAAGDPAGMRVEYRFTAADGVVFLLRRARLRTPPRRFELTANGHGGNLQLGLLIRDGIDDELFEYRSPLALTDDNWATVEVPTVAAAVIDGEVNGRVDSLDGGGGARLEGIVVRRAAGGAESGRLELGPIKVICEVEATQQAMIDSVTGRLDGLFVGDEPPAPELLVSSMAFGPATVAVEWKIVDQQGRPCGAGTEQVSVRGERLARVKLAFDPPAEHGHFTLTASATVGGSRRACTDRFCRLPAVAAGEPRLAIAVEREPGALEAWIDPLLVRAARRTGAGSLVVPAGADVAHWAALAQAEGLRLIVQLPAPVYDPQRPAGSVTTDEVVRQVESARAAAGESLYAVALWPYPEQPRGWPPAPRPVAYRELLAALRERLGADGPALISGGLARFETGFVATLLQPAPAPLSFLGYTAPWPRLALPLPAGEAAPSTALAAQLAAQRAWRGDVPPPWLGPIAVRTSPLEESKAAQAVELARLAALSLGRGGGLSWGALRDGAGESERYGLLRRDFRPKEACAALAASAAMLGGTRLLGRAALGDEAEGSVLTGPGGFVAVAFGAGRLELQGETTVTDLWGNPSEERGLGAEPLYVTGAGVAASIQVAR